MERKRPGLIPRDLRRRPQFLVPSTDLLALLQKPIGAIRVTPDLDPPISLNNTDLMQCRIEKHADTPTSVDPFIPIRREIRSREFEMRPLAWIQRVAHAGLVGPGTSDMNVSRAACSDASGTR